MSSTSQKHKDFVKEPMDDKPVTQLPGIGPALGARLADQGYGKAYHVLGKFLVLNKNEDEFIEWLKGKCNADKKQACDCYKALKEWSDNFV